MNKRGIALIISYIVIIIIITLSAAFVTRSISEGNIVRRHTESTQAFWLAEAGIASALEGLPSPATVNGNMTVDNKQGSYTAVINPVGGFASRFEITSTGSIGNSQRMLRVVAELPPGPNPLSITDAIATTGGLTIKGSVDINPDDSYETNSTLSFEDVFGVAKEAVRNIADHIYTNPSENQQPVDGITCVDLTGDTPQTATTYKISSNWSGNGILIIDGHRNDSTDDIAALEISGNWDFDGVVWVIGKIKISGTPVITGGVFAESSVDVDSTLTGNATLNFSSEEVGESFALLGALSSPEIITWQEL